MIIIPEAEAIVILVPRVGSTALKDVLLAAFPNAFMPYRHMEADGVPAGYEGYQKYGLVRKPIERLWSMWHYILHMKDNRKSTWDSFGIDQIVAEAETGFREWMFEGTVPFARSSSPTGKVYPRYHTLHPDHEFNKSQYVYLRPDLGTEVFPFHLAQNMLDALRDRAVETYPVAPLRMPPHKVNAAARAMPRDLRWQLMQDMECGEFHHLWWDHDRAGGWL